LAVAEEVHPTAFVTLKLYVPEIKPDMVLLDPVPFIAPGLIVQFPDGKPLSTTIPVETVHVGCVIVPTIGTAGVTGWALITTLADARDVHPIEFVTVKLRVPAARPDMVVLAPVPAIAPGLIVQLPVGNPLNSTLPVEIEQVGWVVVPTMGADGVAAIITTLVDASEVHPTEFVTVYAYVPALIAVIVLLAPVAVIPPGLIVQIPVGKPDKTTLPVDMAHVGCVIVPTIGADGVIGCVPIIMLSEGNDIQPTPLLTVKVYVPVAKPDIVVLVPLPDMAPGLIVQLPAGNPVNKTLPVATEHEGCVTVPIVGAAGVPGSATITILLEGDDVHPTELVTV